MELGTLLFLSLLILTCGLVRRIYVILAAGLHHDIISELYASAADVSAAMLSAACSALVTTRVGAGTNATGSLCRALICFNWHKRAALALACRPACRSAAAAAPAGFSACP